MVCSPKAPLSMEFPRQEYWTGLPFDSPEDLPDPGIEPGSPALQADSLPAEQSGTPDTTAVCVYIYIYRGREILRQRANS